MPAAIDVSPQGAWNSTPPTFTRNGPNTAELAINYYGGGTRVVFQSVPSEGPNKMNESDILSRLGSVERTLGDVRTDVAAIKNQVSHVATRAWVLGGVITSLLMVGGALIWVVQQYLGPLMKATGAAG